MLEGVTASTQWRQESAWPQAVAEPGRFGNPQGEPGVVLRFLPPAAMATIIVRASARAAFNELVRARWGFDPPDQRCARCGPAGDLIWSAPNQWLAIGGRAGDAARLAAELADGAAVSEQGDGRALVEIDGPSARDMLSKLVSIDLHPDVFTAGTAAVTAFAHLSVQLWCRDDNGTLVLCVPRTVAGSVWSALRAAASPFGCISNAAA